MASTNTARFWSEHEKRMNIPDETDEEYLARLTAAARSKKTTKAKRRLSEANAGRSVDHDKTTLKKPRTDASSSSTRSGSTELKVSNPNTLPIIDHTGIQVLSAIKGVKRKTQGDGKEVASSNTEAKRARSTYASSTSPRPQPAARSDRDVLSPQIDQPASIALGDSGVRLRDATAPEIVPTNTGDGSASVNAREGTLSSAQASSGVGPAQVHHESAQAIVQNASADARGDHDGSGAQPNGGSSGRSRVHTTGGAVLVVSDKETSDHIAASEPAVQGGDRNASVPRAHRSPEPAARHAKGARSSASAGQLDGGQMETPKGKAHAADKSSVTTPGDSSSHTLSFVVKGSRFAIAGPSKLRTTAASKSTVQLKKSKSKKETVQEPRVPPPEFVRWLQEQFDSNQMRRHSSLYFEGKCVFYVSSDYQNATDSTRRKLKFLFRYGATVMPEFDNEKVTHIVADAALPTVLRACGLKKLDEIRADIPILNWNWAASPIASETGKFSRWHSCAAFQERVLYDPETEAQMKESLVRGKAAAETKAKAKAKAQAKGKAKAPAEPEHDSESDEEVSGISEFTMAHIFLSKKDDDNRKPSAPPKVERPRLDLKPIAAPRSAPSSRHSSRPAEQAGGSKHGRSEDPLAEFYDEAREQQRADIVWEDWNTTDYGSSSDNENSASEKRSDGKADKRAKKEKTYRGFQCDKKGPVKYGDCPNQDIVDRLTELKGLHKNKLSSDDGWRVYTYDRVIPAIRNHPVRITSYEEALKIPHVGEKTAQKIMEIVKTGNLTRIAYERTEDVTAIELFSGIYGVGRNIAHKWYTRGCRTLEDVKGGKGGVKLSHAQKIGLEFYDDINTRMPRQEAQEIFDLIKPVALGLDPRLFVEIMGSFRRGKADCGDIDILITRPTDDGKTHSGILRRLLAELHKRGIVTEDLCVPEDWDDLELVYRGLCRRDKTSARRRIDFLAVPYESRGAALLYYTGDDIFNRSMRLKANKMGYSLNQRGLYHNVIRNPRNRTEKLENGQILASETEREIFGILGVPWQEPHERVRS